MAKPIQLTSDEQDYLLNAVRERYDVLYKGQRDGRIDAQPEVAVDWPEAEEEKLRIAGIVEKLLGHKPQRVGYQYR